MEPITEVGAGGLEVAGRINPRIVLTLSRISRSCAVGTAAIGAVVLAGHLTATPWAIRLSSGLPPMYPITAAAFVFGGAAAASVASARRWVRHAGTAAASFVLATGIVDLLLHAFDVGPTPFDIYPADPVVPATTPVAGRPVAETGLAFVAIGTSLVLAAVRRAARTSQILALAGLMVGTSALLGYLIGVDRTSLGTSLVAVGMALHTAVALTLLSTASLLSRAGSGFLRVVSDAGPGGRLGRRMLVVALLAPMLLAATDAWLVSVLPDDTLAASWFAALHVMALGLLVIVPIRALERYEAAANLAAELEQRDVEAGGTGALTEELLSADMRAPLPAVRGYRISVSHEPAHGHVAGDSLQVLVRDSSDGEEVLVAVLDVAGHDAVAGTLAFRLRNHVEALWNVGCGLERIVTQLNSVVVGQASLASAFLCTVEPGGARIRYANAGHPAALLRGDRATTRLELSGPVLGIPATTRGVRTVAMPVGSRLVVFTDGLHEARDRKGQELGEEAVERLVNNLSATLSPSELSEALLDAARTHTGGRLRDDVLVLVLAHEPR